VPEGAWQSRRAPPRVLTAFWATPIVRGLRPTPGCGPRRPPEIGPGPLPSPRTTPAASQMSAIGRIFIVLNLILAAAFLGWAAQANGSIQNYKQKYEAEVAGRKQDAADHEDALSALRLQVADLTEDARSANGARDTAKALADSLQGQLDDAQRENGAMQGKLDEIASTLGDYNATITQLMQEKDSAVQRANDAERARDDATAASQKAEMAKRDAEDATTQAKAQIAKLQEANAQLTKKADSLDTEINSIVATYNIDRSNVEPQKQIEGAVLEARFDIQPGLVMLNVGQDAGVKRGNTFHIYRGGQYKGKVRVENVQKDYCSAVVVGLAEGRTITQGDRASTVL